MGGTEAGGRRLQRREVRPAGAARGGARRGPPSRRPGASIAKAHGGRRLPQAAGGRPCRTRDAARGRGREVRDAAHPGQTAALARQQRAAGQRGGRRRAHGPQSDHPRTSAARGSFLWVTDGTLEQWQEGLTGWTSGPGGNPRKQPGGRAAGAEGREGQMSTDPSACGGEERRKDAGTPSGLWAQGRGRAEAAVSPHGGERRRNHASSWLPGSDGGWR